MVGAVRVVLQSPLKCSHSVHLVAFLQILLKNVFFDHIWYEHDVLAYLSHVVVPLFQCLILNCLQSFFPISKHHLKLSFLVRESVPQFSLDVIDIVVKELKSPEDLLSLQEWLQVIESSLFEYSVQDDCSPC